MTNDQLPPELLMLLGELREGLKSMNAKLDQLVTDRREDAQRITSLENRMSALEGKAWGVGMAAKAAWIAVAGVVGIGLKLIFGA